MTDPAALPTRAARARETVSACLIVRDEEARLPACLDSVAFCDEIVVVDSGSQDRTREIAAQRGARVVENPWPGFSAQRNVALEHARGAWALEVDADERVSAPLRDEIEAFLAAPPVGVDMAALPRRERFLGAELGPAAKYPNYQHRLFRRDRYRHDESRTVHEGLWPRGRTWAFEGELEHVLAGGWREALRDAWSYARLEAAQLEGQPTLATVLTGLGVRPLAKFHYRLLIDGGWRDGWRGAVKITLDCSSDALVWARHVARRRQEPAAPATRGPAGHFSDRAPAHGPPRLVAIAHGEHARRARDWLYSAAACGADVSLITDQPIAASPPLRVRRVTGWGPVALARVLDAEQQVRAIDALVLAPGSARRAVRLVPARLRGAAAPVGLDTSPERALAEVGTAARAA